MKILVTIPEGDLRELFFPEERRKRLESLGTVEWNQTAEQFTPAALRNRLAGVDVCITGWGCPELDEDVLRDANELELVAHVGGSVAAIGSDALYDAGVTVCSANAVLAKYVAEGIMSTALAALRNVPQFDATLKDGGWDDSNDPAGTLYDATVGFVGLGAVGRNLLELLTPFDAEVRLYDPYVSDEEVASYGTVERTDLETALRSADVVSIHAPKTSETVRMLDADRLAQLPDGCLLINAARGAIVDQDALVEELRSGRISAALDVYEEEPLPADSPLRTFDNVVLTPHVAGTPARNYMPDAVLDEIERFVTGQPFEHAVPRERFRGMTDDRLRVDDE